MSTTFPTSPLNNAIHKSDEQIYAEQQDVINAQQDPMAFSKLYDRYFEGIFNFIYRRTDHEALTADLTSQVFLKALQSIKKYKFKGLPFSAWLYRIASNEVNKHYRKHNKKALFRLEEGKVADLIDDDHQNEDHEENIKTITQCLKELPTESMEIIELRFFENMSFKEIAFVLGISESGAKMRNYRTLEKLKEQFDIKLSQNNG